MAASTNPVDLELKKVSSLREQNYQFYCIPNYFDSLLSPLSLICIIVLLSGIISLTTLLQAFQELQGKVVFTQKQLKVNDAQIESLRRQNQHSSIVKTEVASLSDTTPTYQSVGRM